MKIYDLDVDVINTVGVIVGSDNMFDRWFLSSHNATNRYESLIEFKNFMLSSISRIFMTGSLNIGTGAYNLIKITGNSHTLKFDNNWFDYVDGAALMIAANNDGIPMGINFDSNSFRGICRNMNISKSMIKFFGVKNIFFTGNGFTKVHVGEEISSEVRIADFNKITINDITYKSRNITFSKSNYDIINSRFNYSMDSADNIIIDEPVLDRINEIFTKGILYKNGYNYTVLKDYNINLVTTIQANSFYLVKVNQNNISIANNDIVLINAISVKIEGICYEIKNTTDGIYIALFNITNNAIDIKPFSISFTICKHINNI